MEKAFLIKNKYILPVTALFLCVLYFLSIGMEKNSRREKSFETALINPSKTELLTELNLYNENGSITFIKEGKTWKSKNDDFEFPIEIKQLENLIGKLKIIRKMYKTLYTIDKNNIRLNPVFTLKYILSDNSESYIDFYSTDFSGTKRFIKINGKEDFYKIENDLDSFFHVESRFWYDPYIIPQNILGEIKTEDFIRITYEKNGNVSEAKKLENIKKLLELRHGSLCLSSNENFLTVLEKIKIELTDGRFIKFNIFKKSEDDFVIQYDIPGWNYSVYISQWTYENLINCLEPSSNKDL